MTQLLFPHVHWAVDPSYIDAFADGHPEATFDGLARALDAGALERSTACVSDVIHDVGIIRIVGPVTKYRTAWTCYAEGTAFTDVEAAIDEAAADDSTKSILLVIDSPGGTVAGLSRIDDAVARVRRRGKPIASYIAGRAGGSAYLAAAGAGVIFSNPRGVIGAVGCTELAVDWYHRPSVAGPGCFEPESQIPLIDQFNSVLLDRLQACRTVEPAVLSRISRGEMLISEQAEAGGLVDVILPFDAAIDRMRRGDLKPDRPRER